MRISTLAIRLIRQLRHDKRTMALVLVVPVIMLTLVYFILDDDNVSYKVAVNTSDTQFEEELINSKIINIDIVHADESLENMVKDGCIAAVDYSGNQEKITIYLDGSDASSAAKVEATIKNAYASIYQEKQQDTIKKNLEEITESLPLKENIDISFSEPDITTEYVYGSSENSLFDNIGAPMIGIIVFFFVYIIAGINFLGERKSGTLEKMLSTPIRRSEIVIGYTLGFSVLALVQTLIVTLFSVYVLGLNVVGSIGLVFLINLVTAISALTLGILLSTLANSEFQLVQFIPIVIIPQIFLCGLFKLSEGWQRVGKFMPLYYSTNALRDVMIKGNGIEEIRVDMLVLLGFSIIFMLLNILILKKQRSI